MHFALRALGAFALVLAVGAVGCATRFEGDVDWNHDADFTAYRSFFVLPARGPESGASNRDHAASEIARVLASRGMKASSRAQADMLVHFSMSTQSRVRLSGGNVRGPVTAGMSIELRDAITREAVYRGWAEKLWEDSLDPKAEISKAVELILSPYPPAS